MVDMVRLKRRGGGQINRSLNSGRGEDEQRKRKGLEREAGERRRG